MGNNQTQQASKNRLKNYKIPQNYYEMCHPNLLDLNIDQKSQYLLSAFILINSQNQKWRKRVEPLLLTKYILTPCRIVTDNYFYQKGCCSSQLSQSIHRINIAYQPFIYSLSLQISSRKHKFKSFTQQQLWKIIKYLTKALIQWHTVYPYQKIHSIMPQNVLLNQKGNIRLVTQYTFPKDSYYGRARSFYQAPQQKLRQVIKTSNQVNKYRVLSSDLYSIGMTVLDCLILEKSEQNNFNAVSQKINYMWEHYQNTYSKQLKSIIHTLLSQDYKKRPNPHDLVQLAQANQTKNNANN